ncbi:MAG: hypothetical protein OEZ39_06955 [Gammaproteobacteria bacterium]|nr:hypothetical protein [Gammaproteobacteria bacterium]MDH5651595.1 hypothetical protein [Gammaproteobacteria bacterium]
MSSSLQKVISAKKAALAGSIEKPLAQIAQALSPAWPDADRMDQVLIEAGKSVPGCHLLYVLDLNGRQISSNIGENIDAGRRGQDLSQRPYFNAGLPYKGMMLSKVYLSNRSLKSCISAIYAISSKEVLSGFLVADFNVTDLPGDNLTAVPSNKWQQFKGDPAVRSTLFMQERVPSLMDQHLNEVNILLDNLMSSHGVFHCKIHYYSGRCSLWLFDDPYHYRIHHVDDIINPEICLAYPLRNYPEQAVVSPEQILLVLEHMKSLRLGDETIYLRSGSLNIMNGMVGLTFSCDGSHYISVEEFLSKEQGFWFGSAA